MSFTQFHKGIALKYIYVLFFDNITKAFSSKELARNFIEGTLLKEECDSWISEINEFWGRNILCDWTEYTIENEFGQNYLIEVRKVPLEK